MSKISIIAAVDRRMAIGFENKLLFWLPNDLKRFKALTTGNTIVMGRKTFESLPKGALPNRRNVVLSSNPAAECPGAEVFPSLETALQSCKEDERRLMPFSPKSRPPYGTKKTEKLILRMRNISARMHLLIT